ncbi:TonB-dependent siderophore receptor [Novosphingobium terrae]|uniref:TonB-dependent siderophore receptor n=1 Tax=Novosphingobium terrae TaxID=2726189 RepID=UPI00198240E8|nr:TonB-dependent receptor [Novosphingobium terrae]
MNDMIGNGRAAARLLATALLAGSVLAGGTMLLTTAAAAQTAATHAYTIPAGALSDALNHFAQQSGLQLNYDAALTRGRTTAGLRGQMSSRDALSQLLSGTGLVAKPSGPDAMTITPASTGAMTLDTLRVEENAPVTLASAEGGTPDSDADEEALKRGTPILVLGHNEQIDAAASTGPWGAKAIIDTPYSINVTSHQMIENMVASDMDQIFKMNPVVQNSAPSTVYGTPYVTIRGFDSQNGIVDGLRLSSTLTGIATEELERVEIMNGLSGFMYGAGNPGGVTNYVLKRPTYTRLSDITVGNYGGQQWFAHVDLGNRIDKNGVLAYRLNISYQDGKTSKQNQNLARTLISGAIDWNAAPNLLVQVEGAHTYYRLQGIDSRFYAYADSNFGALGHWIPALDNSKTYTPSWTYNQTKTDRIGANAKWKLSDAFSLRAAYLYKRDEAESINIYPAYFADKGYVDGWPSRSAPSWNYAMGAYAYLDSSFQTFGIRHHLTLGASGDTLRVVNHLNSYISADNSPAYTNPNDLMNWAMPAELTATDWGGTYKASYATNANIILGDDIQLTDKLGALLGLNRTTIMAKNYETTGVISSAYDKTAYTPTVSLVFKPVKRLTTYASYMQGLEQGTIIPNTAAYNNPGQILKPFLSKQYEVGVKYAPTNALLLTGALYRIEKANSYETRTPDGKITISQDGIQVHQGLELTATGQLTKQLSAVLGGTFMDLKVTKADDPTLIGTRPTGVSDRLLKAYLDYSLPWVPGLSVTGGAYHAGTMYKDSANLQKIPGYTIFDLGLHFKTQVDKHPLRFDLNIANITGRDYWATSYSLGIPRNVAFSVKYGF